MTASTKTKSAKASATTDIDPALVRVFTVNKLDDASNGKFVRFCATAELKNIEWQVYISDSKILFHKINEGSELTVWKDSIFIADAYDKVNKVKLLNAEGKTYEAPVVYSWMNPEGQEVVYQYGRGTLDIKIKIVKNETNPNIGEAQAKTAFDPFA